MEEQLELAEDRYCARHFCKKGRFKGESLKANMMNAAKASTVAGFLFYMEEIMKENEEAYNWLVQKDSKQWARSHFRDWTKCDILMNNLCES